MSQPAPPANTTDSVAPDSGAPDSGAPDSGANGTVLEEHVVLALRTVYDPEIPVNIYELGLIYGLAIDPQGHATIQMTLTSPNCPVAGSLPGEVQQKVESVAGISGATVELVWDPAWNPSMMTEAARLELGMF